MPPASRVPALLQPYVRLPNSDSILLVTSTLGASTNWLLIRFLCDALNPVRHDAGQKSDNSNNDVKVIFASWMRDWEFWKAEARKGGGLDLERLKRDKRFAFVDGTPGHFTLTSPDLTQLQETVKSALEYLNPSTSPTPPTTLLILDDPSLLLATVPSLTPSSLTSTILKLQALLSPSISTPPTSSPSQNAHAHAHIILSLPADDALLAPSAPTPQPLEISAHNILVKAAHMSARILSCRVLDTGVARDVSGVLRVTDNGGGRRAGGEGLLDFDDGGGDGAEGRTGREFLYKVGGDGGVRVFERGNGGE
ncbi:hypothetical protein BU24DRAFT_338158 [Aaosphaeria arxii CBS 175.79]|uniref:Elongator complex protein 6 n=1 Tax=Aaosphaeria arxii CBS 175.79 TaxID=1450172 RepID=A0A6A5YA59_9PLEO|nr:uncharacterized protein BU24DRAFT_338158 [Aaosphaeria arxii CBS 175.79]KAF2021897.1 hypothetical protein BU24DRAFT_338158 [Aaosphaeria arxii CBS 175.79]